METGSTDSPLNDNSTQSLSKIWKDTFGEESLCEGTEDSSSGTVVSSEASSTDTHGGVSVGNAEPSYGGELAAGVASEKTGNAIAEISNPKSIGITDTKEICNEENASTDSLKDSKIVSRPRSMSMGHFSRKRQEVTNKVLPKASRSSADDILSANSATTSAHVRRKESIFEGVDISVEGPNPVHAILLQYSLLSSTQSMPSVCSTLPRRHSDLPCKQSESDTSSSKDSVFSQTEAETGSTQPKDITESAETQNVPTGSDGTSNGQSDKSVPDTSSHITHKYSNEGHITRTLSHSHVGHSDSFRRSVPFKSHSMLRFTETKFSKDSANTKAREDKREKEEKGVPEKPKSEENVYEAIRSYSFSDNLLSSGSPRKQDCSDAPKDDVAFKDTPRPAIVPTPQRPALPRRVRAENASLTNIRDTSFSASRTLSPSSMNQSSTDLSSRRSTFPRENSKISFGSTGMLSRAESVASSKRSVPGGANSGKRIRRFGMHLDTKLIQNLLTRRDKTKPVASGSSDTRSKESNVAENNSMKLNSTKDCSKLPEKENSYVSPKTSSLDLFDDEYGMARLLESNDRSGLQEEKTCVVEVDDEYGMSVLLDSSKTLTSTPLMPKKERSGLSSLTKHSFVSDEGYSPSQGSNTPPSRRRRRPHKISIRSDHTWISTDMEDSDVTHHSSQISPYTVSSSTNTSFSFKGFPANRHMSGSDSSGANSSRGRISPEWDMRSRRSSSVSFLCLSTDVPESSL